MKPENTTKELMAQGLINIGLKLIKAIGEEICAVADRATKQQEASNTSEPTTKTERQVSISGDVAH